MSIEDEALKAIKSRCKECNVDKTVCDISNCQINKLLIQNKKLDIIQTLKKYCKDCANEYNYKEACCSKNCAVYKFREKNNM